MKIPADGSFQAARVPARPTNVHPCNDPSSSVGIRFAAPSHLVHSTQTTRTRRAPADSRREAIDQGHVGPHTHVAFSLASRGWLLRRGKSPLARPRPCRGGLVGCRAEAPNAAYRVLRPVSYGAPHGNASGSGSGACFGLFKAADNRRLECRHCGCRHFRVTYTRPASGGRIQRRRECRHCGKRMTTWERPVGA